MKILKYQFWHILLLAALLSSLYLLVKTDPMFLSGSLWDISTINWCVFAILIPILHQFYVLICWRSELHYKSISNLFGKKGFKIYKTGFIFLILSRPISITLLAISNANTFNISSIFSYTVSGLLIIPFIYLLYSVRKYFGGDRVVGIDHFYSEEYKKVPFVKKGIFKYTSNGMYLYGFFILWLPGILFESKMALTIAAFNHAYIWVHYYCTELPDCKLIYNKDENDYSTKPKRH